MSFRAAMLAALLVAISMPAMAQSRACHRLYREYVDSNGPKAWAAGPDGCGFSSARTASSLPDARRRAYVSCSEYSRACRVTEEENY